MKNKEKQTGSLILDPDKVLIQYSKHKIDMRIQNNNTYTLLLIGLIKREVNMFGYFNTTLDYIVKECGYFTKGNSKENNKIFKEALIQLNKENFILFDSNIDLYKLRNNELFRIYINENNDLYYFDSNFVIITVSDFNKIVSYKSKSVKIGTLLNTFLAIKQFIFKGNNGIAYPSKYNISKIIGVSSTTTVENAINVLVELELIYISNDYYIKNKDGTDSYIQTRRVYGLTEDSLKYAKSALRDLYNDKTVYSLSEIDASKIIRLKSKGEK